MKKNKCIFCIVVWLVFTSTNVFCQIDTSKKIKYLIDKFDLLSESLSSSDEGFNNLKRAYLLSQTCDCDSLKIEVYTRLDDELAFRNQPYGYYLKKAIFIAEKKKDYKLLVKIYTLYGRIELEQGGKNDFLYQQKALYYAEKTKNPFYLSVTYLELGLVVFDQKQRAQFFFYKALDEANKINGNYKDVINEFTPVVMKSYAYIYLTMTMQNKDSIKVYQFTKLAYDGIRDLEDTNVFNREIKKTALMQLTKLNIKHQDFNSALSHNKELLFLAKLDNDKFFLMSTYLNFSKIYYFKKEYDNAAYFMKLFESNIDVEHSYKMVSKMYNFNRLFANISAHTGNLKKSNSYLESEIINLDSLLTIKKDRINEEFAVKYETEQKKTQIAYQKLKIKKQESFKNNFLFAVAIMLLIVIGGAILLINRHKNKNKIVDLALKKEKEFNTYRTQFLENITHEIRTPLTLLNGYLELALESNTIDKCQLNIGKAQKSSVSVLENANELLSLLKFDIDQKQVKFVSVLIEPFVKRVFSSFESMVALKKIELLFNASIPKDFYMVTDTDKLEKILNNLISNAIKYSPSHTKIIFSLLFDKKELIIKILDEGIGISEQEIDKIFNRFYQSESSNSISGFGIGLALAKEFALLLGGNITVNSIVGKGSEFILTLPIQTITEIHDDNSMLIKKEAIVGEIRNFNITTQTKSEKALVLVVEDNMEMVAYYKEILSSYYDCHFAYDGKQGIKMAQKKQFDLIVSDIMMPNVDGFAFKKLLKMIPTYSAIPFVLVSAKGMSKDKIMGFEIGIDDYITKPFDKNELIARLDNLLLNVKARNTWVKENPDLLLPPHEDAGRKILLKFEKVILENLSDEMIKVNELAQKIGYTQRKLSCVVNEMTGLTLIQFILEIRLTEAYRLIQIKEFQTINEVRYQVGINSASYFNKTFKQRFGIIPSELN